MFDSLRKSLASLFNRTPDKLDHDRAMVLHIGKLFRDDLTEEEKKTSHAEILQISKERIERGGPV